MFCAKCGREVKVSDSYCQNCGLKLESQSNTAQKKKEAEKKEGGILQTLFTTNFFIIIGLIGWLGALGKDPDSSAGLAIFIGSLAYKSMKNSKLSRTNPSMIIRGLEILGIITVLVLAFSLWFTTKGVEIVNDPFPYMVPVIVLVVIGINLSNLKKKRGLPL